MAQWQKNKLTREQVNDRLYQRIFPDLKDYFNNEEFHGTAYDALLLIRELVDNLYRHNNCTYIWLQEARLDQNKYVVVIRHNGAAFDPFDPGNGCKLICGLKSGLNISPAFTAGDSGSEILTFEIFF